MKKTLMKLQGLLMSTVKSTMGSISSQGQFDFFPLKLFTLSGPSLFPSQKNFPHFSRNKASCCLWLLLSSMLAFFKGFIKPLNWIAQPLIKLCLWMHKVLLFENAKLKYYIALNNLPCHVFLLVHNNAAQYLPTSETLAGSLFDI